MQWHIATPCMHDATTLSGQRPFSTQNVHCVEEYISRYGDSKTPP